ncbi:hypothetical protein EGJ54_21900 [Pandoraea apista]|nr:hypothetical protein EGJ54_21900 [Pandoraea apista]RRX00400.1 hypothetical protein EGJ56_19145 [Pandoraea apista]
MNRTESWQHFEEAANAALCGFPSVPRAYLAEVRNRCGEAVAARQEKELRAFIAYRRRGK